MNRFLRHLIAPLVAYLVSAGYLPEAAQGDVTEAVVMAVAFIVAYVWSVYNERTVKAGQGVKNG